VASHSAQRFHAIFFDDKQLGSLGLGRPNHEGKGRGSVQAYHKVNTADLSPYCVPNEYICGEIGRVMTLPIPPVALTTSEVVPAATIFSSLDFEWERETLVDAEADRCAATNLDLCTGILIFDILIANPDREHWNLRVDDPLNPKVIRVFDHEQALFGAAGASRLDKQRDDIGLKWPRGRASHCLLQHVASGAFLPKWIDIATSLPRRFMRHVCDSAVGCGITQDDADAAFKFLDHRSATISTILSTHRSLFQKQFFAPPAGRLV